MCIRLGKALQCYWKTRRAHACVERMPQAVFFLSQESQRKTLSSHLWLSLWLQGAGGEGKHRGNEHLGSVERCPSAHMECIFAEIQLSLCSGDLLLDPLSRSIDLRHHTLLGAVGV